MTPSDVTVAICAIPTRSEMLARAFGTVLAQTVTPGAVHVRFDHERGGHADNRNKLIAGIRTEWVAFLDDDDELDPNHLETLCDAANESGADLIYPWHRIHDRAGRLRPDLLNGKGVPFDEQELRTRNYIPVTVLARTELVRQAGFPVSVEGGQWWKCEDWGCWIRMLNLGARFHHVDAVTWTWNHHGANTSGQGDRW